MRSVGGGDGVGLPDIHLVTAGTVLARSSVRVIGGTSPAESVGLGTGYQSHVQSINKTIGESHLSVDELDVVGALRITVSGSVLGTGLVVGVLSETTIGVHLGEIERAVETARKLGDINIEGEFGVVQVEQLVVACVAEQEDTGSNVGVGTLGDELDGQGVTRGSDT